MKYNQFSMLLFLMISTSLVSQKALRKNVLGLEITMSEDYKIKGRRPFIHLSQSGDSVLSSVGVKKNYISGFKNEAGKTFSEECASRFHEKEVARPYVGSDDVYDRLDGLVLTDSSIVEIRELKDELGEEDLVGFIYSKSSLKLKKKNKFSDKIYRHIKDVRKEKTDELGRPTSINRITYFQTTYYKLSKDGLRLVVLDFDQESNDGLVWVKFYNTEFDLLWKKQVHIGFNVDNIVFNSFIFLNNDRVLINYNNLKNNSEGKILSKNILLDENGIIYNNEVRANKEVIIKSLFEKFDDDYVYLAGGVKSSVDLNIYEYIQKYKISDGELIFECVLNLRPRRDMTLLVDSFRLNKNISGKDSIIMESMLIKEITKLEPNIPKNIHNIDNNYVSIFEMEKEEISLRNSYSGGEEYELIEGTKTNGAIHVSLVDSLGDLKWERIIEKWQISPLDFQHYKSYVSLVKGDFLYLVFNDINKPALGSDASEFIYLNNSSDKGICLSVVRVNLNNGEVLKETALTHSDLNSKKCSIINYVETLNGSIKFLASKGNKTSIIEIK